MYKSAAAKSETACHQVAAQKIASADGMFEAQCPLDTTELCACISGYLHVFSMTVPTLY